MDIFVAATSVSKYVDETVLRELFAKLGTVIGMERVNNDYIIHFTNLSEVAMAVCLNTVEFGGKKLQVLPRLKGPVRSNFDIKEEEITQKCKTLLVKGINHVDILQELLPLNDACLVFQVKEGCFLIEFESRQEAMQALLKMRTKYLSDPNVYKGVHGEDALRAIYSSIVKQSDSESDRRVIDDRYGRDSRSYDPNRYDSRDSRYHESSRHDYTSRYESRHEYSSRHDSRDSRYDTRDSRDSRYHDSRYDRRSSPPPPPSRRRRY